MGFYKRSDAKHIIGELCTLASEASSGYNDGWTASSCKRELYLVKCYLDDVYKKLPVFGDEERWEQERLIEILKRK